ncbi:unnamed protein product, partial [Cylicostephanus goldi]
MLFNSMDTFFSYGLLSGDKVYWRFVREFLPRTQQNLLRAEWGDIDNRRLSIAWLKDAFNKGTLHFQMLAFRNNRKIIARFYHRNACMSNGGMLEAVTDMIVSLVNVQFAFYSTLNLRVEPAQAVVVMTPTAPIVKAKTKRRKREESERDLGPVVVDKLPPPIQATVVPTPKDQELILDELVRNRRSRLQSLMESSSFDKNDENADSGMNTSGDSSEQPVRNEAFDELRLHSGDILKLAMNVYVDEGERLLHMYHVYQKFAAGTPQQRLLAVTDHNIYVITQNVELILDELVRNRRSRLQSLMESSSFDKNDENADSGMNTSGDSSEQPVRNEAFDEFAAGTPQQRLLAVTDHNIYVITQNVVLEDSAQPGGFEEGGHRNVFYEVHVVISLPNVDYIGVSRDAQVLILYAKSGLPFRVMNDVEGTKDKTCAIATGDVQLGNAIVKTITTAAESGNHEPPAVFTESTPYSLILKRYLTKELNGAVSPHIELQHFALVYWKESSALVDKQGAETVGYLYRRMVHPNWWRKPPA